MLSYERQAWARGVESLAGVDEAGWGPLAGPVIAAAIVFDPIFLKTEAQGCLRGLTDSKQLSARQRDHFFSVLTNCPCLHYGIGMADVQEIDTLNILRATHLAMARALQAMDPLPDHALVDGLPVKGLPCDSTAIVKGDSLSLSIAAASVLAKVTRDRLMLELDRQYPGYGLAQHKGYGTRKHLNALKEKGPSACHRRSFAPVKIFFEHQPDLFPP